MQYSVYTEHTTPDGHKVTDRYKTTDFDTANQVYEATIKYVSTCINLDENFENYVTLHNNSTGKRISTFKMQYKKGT